MKYVIVKHFGREIPHMFCADLDHRSIWEALGRPEVVGAGLVTFTEKGLSCFGDSLTLGKSSRKQVDSEIINRLLGV